MTTEDSTPVASSASTASERPSGLTDRQRLARESFDLETTLAAASALAPRRPSKTPSINSRGQAGHRLRTDVSAIIDDDQLRELARLELGAKRCSEGYLNALRIVLGNQASAEKYGYVLEMNQRVPFATQRVMRTIISQMKAVKNSFNIVVRLGGGRSQVVRCFASKGVAHPSPEHEIEYLLRLDETANDARREAAIARGDVSRNDATELAPVLVSLDGDIPY